MSDVITHPMHRNQFSSGKLARSNPDLKHEDVGVVAFDKRLTIRIMDVDCSLK